MPDQIARDVHLPVDPAAAWAAITDPRWLRRWLADEVELELTPGGSAEFLIDGERRSGWVEEVRAPHDDRAGSLAFWWQADDEPASRVSLEVCAEAGGTRVTVVEARPLEVLDLVGIPFGGGAGHGPALGPALVLTTT